MDVGHILGWAVWVVVVLVALAEVYQWHKSGNLLGATVSIIANHWILVIWPLVFSDFNKLHLFWLAPLAYLLGLGTMFVFPLGGKQVWLLIPIGINLALLWVLSWSHGVC